MKMFVWIQKIAFFSHAVIASALRSAKQSRKNLANSRKAKFIFLNNRYVHSGLLRATERARNDVCNRTQIIILVLWFLPCMAFAQKELTHEGIGGVASNLMVPVTVASGFISAASFTVGVSCVLASIIRYREYRRNPLAQPLSKVVTLALLGIFALLLPLVAHMTESGVKGLY